MSAQKISFSKFLQEHSIFSKKQSDTFSLDTLNINDESQSIFHLADFFKALTPSDSYDLALRLFLVWKHRPNITQNSTNNVDKFVRCLDKLRKKRVKEFINTLKILIKSQDLEVQIQEATFRDTEGFNSQFLETNPDTMNNSTKNFTNKSMQQIHERLYSTATSIRHTKFHNEERKILQELKGCTFKPELNKSELIQNKVIENNLPVFERLLVDKKKEILKENETKKAENEMKGCTFHPKTENSPLKLKNSFMNQSNVPENTFERLHKESTLKKQIKIENEIKKQELEVEGCTFQPQLLAIENSISGTKSFEDGLLVTERIQRLYNLHFQKQRDLIKKKVESDENEFKKYAFKPEIIKTNQVEEKVDNQKIIGLGKRKK